MEEELPERGREALPQHEVLQHRRDHQAWPPAGESDRFWTRTQRHPLQCSPNAPTTKCIRRKATPATEKSTSIRTTATTTSRPLSSGTVSTARSSPLWTRRSHVPQDVIYSQSDGTCFLANKNIPVVALIDIRWAAVNTTVWRCVTTVDIKQSPNRVGCPQGKSNSPATHEEVSSSSTERSHVILKEAMDTKVGGRGLSPAEVKHFASAELEVTHADKKQNSLLLLPRSDVQ